MAKNCCGGIKFYETSCQTGENVEKAINDLVNDVYNKYSGNIPEDKDNNLIIEKDRKRQGNQPSFGSAFPCDGTQIWISRR